MIAVSVNNRFLFIPADTVLSLEQRNSAFDSDNFGSDLVWTFDLPAEPNDAILDGARFICLPNYRRYPCRLSLDGIPIADGQLYIQQVSDQRTLSCGVILNGLNAEFGGRRLADNNFGPDITISQPSDDLETHRANFRQFLANSLSPESIYKFFLFYDPDFYHDNPDFGSFRGLSSPLENSGAQDLVTHLVNRLFFDDQGTILENSASDPLTGINRQGVRLFNERADDGSPCNGYTFAPALRLDWILRQLFASAGFSLSGSFLRNPHTAHLFIQSLNALDGDIAQLGITEHLYINSGASGIDCQSSLTTRLDVGIGQGEHTFNAFRILTTAPTVNWSFKFNTDTFQTSTLVTTNTTPFTLREEALFLVISAADGTDPSSTYYDSANHSSAPTFSFYRSAVDTSLYQSRDFIYGSLPYYGKFYGGMAPRLLMADNNQCSFLNVSGQSGDTSDFLDAFTDFYAIQLTTTTGNTVPREQTQDADLIGNFAAEQMLNLDRSKNYVVRLCRIQVDTVQHGPFTSWEDLSSHPFNLQFAPDSPNYGQTYIQIPTNGQLERLTVVDTIVKTELSNTNTLLNVFDRALRWHQHLPDLSNADFIKTVCRAFGLVLFTDPFSRSIQLDYFADLLKAQSLDLSDYVTSSQRLTFDPKQYSVTLSPLLSTATIADDYRLDPIPTADSLPAPRTHKKKSIFVLNEGAYRTSTLDSDSGKYFWEQRHGDDRPLSVGQADTVTEENIPVSIPAMHLCDGQRTTKLLCRINATGCSKLLDDDYTGSFPLILQQYLGPRPITLQTSSESIRIGFLPIISRPFIRSANIEYANPVGLDEQGNPISGALSLSANGDRSIGQQFLRPYYQFMAAAENYRFILRIPASLFFPIRQLLMPQTVIPSAQTRWILINSQRYLPSVITYEFSSADYIIVTIDCSRLHIDT